MAREINHFIRKYSIFFFLLIAVFGLGQQKPTPKDSIKKIKHLHSDVMKVDPTLFDGNPFAHGKVGFEHQGTRLYSDSAVYYQSENYFRAWSNVRVVNDTMNMRSDSLEYSGNSRVIRAFDNVHLKDTKSELFADFVEYNRMTDFAIASGNVVIIDPSQTIETPYMTYDRKTGIISTNEGAIIRGQDGSVTHTQVLVYNANSQEVTFDQKTVITTEDVRIDSEKMIMNQATDETIFIGNSTVTDRNNPRNYIRMPEGGGTYNKRTGEAFLKKRSTIYRDGKELWGDEMYFNEQTGFGWAKGNVLINDPEEERFIKGDYGEVHRDLDSAFVTGNAYAVKAFSTDSLYFAADTIMAVQRADSTRIIKAYYNARFYKSENQGKSDSIFYNETIGLMKFIRDPIMWSGEQQITGDTIYAYNDPIKEVMDSVRVFYNAFAISKVDSLNPKDFNQVKGNHMTGYFVNNELRFIEVNENAQSITFVDEEDKESGEKDRIGINLSDCGIIEVEITKSDVDVLACLIQANSRLYPESKIPDEMLFLNNFKWRGDERMRRWQDIFVHPTDFVEESFNTDETETTEIVDLDEWVNSDQEVEEN